MDSGNKYMYSKGFLLWHCQSNWTQGDKDHTKGSGTKKPRGIYNRPGGGVTEKQNGGRCDGQSQYYETEE
jgi:hypothetical protein